MGLTGAAVGFNNALQQILADRYAQQAAEQSRKDHLRQQQFDNDMKVQQFQSNEELKHAQLDATSEARHQAAIGQQVGQANALGDQLPEGTFLPEGDQGASIMQTGGRGSLLTPQDERPAVETGPLLPGDTGAAKAKGYIKTASAKQINERTDNERQAAAQQQTAKAEADRIARENANAAETHRHNVASENRPQSAATVTIKTVDDAGNQVTRVVPKSEAIGKDYKAAPNASTANRLDSAKAVQQTGEDIIRQLSDPVFIAAVGPAMGRANKLADFIGSPPPEFSGLAGQIESYALANMGVHGMRSAQGAAQISKLLDQHHTPESLIAAIKGLNGFSQHFMENAGRGGPSGGGMVRMTAPDGRSLQVPADKVAELERAGAKRVP
jgi:hypothetical protein